MPDDLSGLIWGQTVCKGYLYQQTTNVSLQAGKELSRDSNGVDVLVIITCVLIPVLVLVKITQSLSVQDCKIDGNVFCCCCCFFFCFFFLFFFLLLLLFLYKH